MKILRDLFNLFYCVYSLFYEIFPFLHISKIYPLYYYFEYIFNLSIYSMNILSASYLFTLTIKNMLLFLSIF